MAPSHPTPEQCVAVESALMDLEAELRQLQLWQRERPSQEALSSTEPFCIDTLTFPQWLQFVFLERMHAMIEAKMPLPEKCGIAPMAEEYFRGGSISGTRLIQVLGDVDSALSQI